MTDIRRVVDADPSAHDARDSREGQDMRYARLLEAERAARAEAEAAARAKSAFLATMSHELRTPLNAIIGYAELLDLGIFGPVTPKQHEHLERLRVSARHLLGLVCDVLDLAKIDAGRLEVRRESAVTGTAVAAALALVQPQATVKGIVVLDQQAGEPGVRYLGDEHRVQQILVNLLSNAVKFTPTGGQITLDCGVADAPDPAALGPGARLEGPGPWAFVRVDDTGPGISPDFMGRLFEPFVQEQADYTREQGGTGLGLSISRRLARMMGGDISVAPPRPELADVRRGGASFTLWLPVEREALGAPSAPADASRLTEQPPALTADAVAVVHALGARVAHMAEAIASRYVLRLRAAGAAGELPGDGRLAEAQLRDHATPFVALVASQLMTVGELRGRAPELLGDGARVQRLMAELHGAQRRRLGWTEAQVAQDYVILCEEMERAFGAAVDEAPTIGAAPRGPGEGADVAADAGTRDAALAYAVDVPPPGRARATRTRVCACAAAGEPVAGSPRRRTPRRRPGSRACIGLRPQRPGVCGRRDHVVDVEGRRLSAHHGAGRRGPRPRPERQQLPEEVRRRPPRERRHEADPAQRRPVAARARRRPAALPARRQHAPAPQASGRHVRHVRGERVV